MLTFSRSNRQNIPAARQTALQSRTEAIGNEAVDFAIQQRAAELAQGAAQTGFDPVAAIDPATLPADPLAPDSMTPEQRTESRVQAAAEWRAAQDPEYQAQVQREQEAVRQREEQRAAGSNGSTFQIQNTDGTTEQIPDISAVTDGQVLNYLERARAGRIRGASYIPVRSNTPQGIVDALTDIGRTVGNLPTVMQVRKAQQSMAKADASRQGKGSNKRKHGLSPQEIVEIINNIDVPNLAILQTNRTNEYGDPRPDNVAVFVPYNNRTKEAVAVIEFEGYDDIGGRVQNLHAVVTVFAPDTIREGQPHDYAEELLSNPNNRELNIERRAPVESATGEKIPNTFNKNPSYKPSITRDEMERNTAPPEVTTGTGESADTYAELQQKHGTLPHGEIPTRDINVPSRDAQGGKVPLSARTIMESNAPDDFVSALKNEVVNGSFF